MLAKNVTQSDLEKALVKVNREFGGNVEFAKLESAGKHIRFRLRVKSSKGPGARLGVPWNGKQRHLTAACWHVHGIFFDSLPASARIVAMGAEIAPGDRWQDKNISSQMYPLMYSDACACNH